MKKRHRYPLCALILLLALNYNAFPVWAANEKNPGLEYIREAFALNQILLNNMKIKTSFPADRCNASYTLEIFSGKKVSGAPSSGESIDYKAHSTRLNELVTANASYKTGGIYSSATTVTAPDTNTTFFTAASDQIYIADASATRQAFLKAKEIASSIAAQASDRWEQVRLVNKYLGSTVTYNISGRAPHSPAGALIDGEAVCEGYAYAFHLIVSELGIPVVNISGTSKDISHIWNKVLIDGQWLYCDVTWNDIGSAVSEEFLLLDKAAFYGKELHEPAQEQYSDIAAETFWRNELETEASALQRKGLFAGDDEGFRLSEGLTRAEMAVILTRTSGQLAEVEKNAAQYAALCSFSDVPAWAKPYVGYCLSAGLVSGIGNDQYGADRQAVKLDFCTVILRAAGIETGYSYNTSDLKAVELGYISEARTAFSDLTRGDVVHVLTRLDQLGLFNL